MSRESVNIAVIDYGAGNISSMVNSLEYIGFKAQVVSSATSLDQFTHIIIPGVGAFDDAMDHLDQSGLVEHLEKAKNSGVFILGVCLGMQILCKSSDEGISSGLGWIDLEVTNLSKYTDVKKVPHMGWNNLIFDHANPIFDGVDTGDDVYFVHSYGVSESYDQLCLAEANCGVKFCCAVRDKNVFGMQFHPEKSQNVGLKILKNFLALKREV